MKNGLYALTITVGCILSAPCIAQNSAPSSHMVFDDQFPGDILINQVRVPKSGEATYTYYETLGWRGEGAGYAGIQAHPKAHLYIFSIWDNPSHAAPIKAVYQGAGTKVEGFGGEGTGLKSWNFDLGWDTDVWYTLVARTWPVAGHTYYGFWVQDQAKDRWNHLVTMDVATATHFKGGTDAFIEDWLNTGVNARTSHLRGGWKRKLDGSWFPFGQCRYSVNHWDLTPGKRSYSFRSNWNGGVQKDETGQYYFMVSGGNDTQPSVKNPSSHAIKRAEDQPAFPPLKTDDVSVKLQDGTIVLEWKLAPQSCPQFSYEAKLIEKRGMREVILAKERQRTPQARRASLGIPVSGTARKSLSVELTLTDIFDRQIRITKSID